MKDLEAEFRFLLRVVSRLMMAFYGALQLHPEPAPSHWAGSTRIMEIHEKHLRYSEGGSYQCHGSHMKYFGPAKEGGRFLLQRARSRKTEWPPWASDWAGREAWAARSPLMDFPLCLWPFPSPSFPWLQRSPFTHTARVKIVLILRLWAVREKCRSGNYLNTLCALLKERLSCTPRVRTRAHE